MSRKGFTLLEVVIALAILAVSLLVLVDAQSGSVLSTVESQKILTGTWLAQEKMAEASLRVEKDGFTSADVDEEGDFADLGASGELGEGVDFGNEFAEYKWAYTIRKVDIQLGDVSGAAEQLEASGYGMTEEEKAAREEAGSSAETPDQRDLGDLGFSPDMISDMLRPYIREVRVVVWWSDEEPDLEEGCEQCVELVSHVINPSGVEQTIQ